MFGEKKKIVDLAKMKINNAVKKKLISDNARRTLSEIERLDSSYQKVKDLEFQYYTTTGKFPDYETIGIKFVK